MGLFHKARSYCSAFRQLEDYERVKELSDQLMKGAEPFLQARGVGYNRSIPFVDVLTTNGALALWITAHDICARREGRQRERFFDTRKVRTELGRLESLLFDGWEYDSRMDEWKRDFISRADFVDCTKALDALLCKGYHWFYFKPPEPNSELSMRFRMEEMKLYDMVRDLELAPVPA